MKIVTFSSNTLLLMALVAGACKNGERTPESKPDQEIAYQSDVRPIIRDYCTTCHRGENASAGLDLTEYSAVRKAAEHGPLLKRIMDAENPMPQSGLMPREERKKILLWAKNGFPENSPSATSAAATEKESSSTYDWTPPTIAPAGMDESALAFFDHMPGHWVGKMNIMGIKYPWFCFDYRPISPSHVHGIFEGGSMGNLFTSFFIADYQGEKRIMARNGGILQGIYRTSYFVMDKAEKRGNGHYYRLVDAYGSTDIMWMELTFTDNELVFKSYTSRLGLQSPPKLHMEFEAKKMHPELAQQAAEKVGYPKNEAAFSFPNGLPTPDWGEEYPVISSFTYMSEGQGKEIITLAHEAGDPVTIDDIPYLGRLNLEIEQNEKIKGHKLEVYLTQKPLTNDQGEFIMEHGYIKEDLYNGLLLFPELEPGTSSFEITYLHPGDYYLTVIADVNKDMYASKGDISSISQKVSIGAKEQKSLRVTGIEHQN
ncbi:hypothetical protein KFE98_17015 [bacterium SCSIO 12741]|nr:hypothetical protein KFE98_17015 [bacterium SCSIO 12741]